MNIWIFQEHLDMFKNIFWLAVFSQPLERSMPYPAAATLPPLFAVQRLADGQWLVRTPMGDPILPGSRQNH